MSLKARLERLEAAVRLARCPACGGVRPVSFHEETGEVGPDGEPVLDPPLPDKPHCQVCNDRPTPGAPPRVSFIIVRAAPPRDSARPLPRRATRPRMGASRAEPPVPGLDKLDL